MRAGGRRAPDGGWAYENVCRGRTITDWRAATEPVRVQLPDDRIELIDLGGEVLSQAPAHDMGDPVVRRRDGVVAYQLAVVVDDAAAGITDIVRGRDIAPSTATQIMLQRLLGLPTPRYRHHFLVLEPSGDKLAKLHGSIGFPVLAQRYTGDELCAVLASAAGLAPLRARELRDAFEWAKIRREDLVATWHDGLVFGRGTESTCATSDP